MLGQAETLLDAVLDARKNYQASPNQPPEEMDTGEISEVSHQEPGLADYADNEGNT